MSYRQCLLRAVQAGNLKQAKADNALQDYDARVQTHLASGKTRTEAETEAAFESAMFMRDRIVAKRRQRVQLAQAQIRHQSAISATDKPWQYLNGLIDTMDQRVSTAKGLLHSTLNEFLERAGYRALGINRPTAHLPNVVRELFGEKTGDRTAAQMASAVRDTEGVIVSQLRARGVDVDADPDWRLPQLHDQGRLQKIGQTEWVDDHLDLVDWTRMQEFNEGRPIPADAASRRAVLERAYMTLATDGAIKKIPGAQQDTSLATRLASRRFIRYKDAASWMVAQEKYGVGDAFQQIATYVDTAATDLALVQEFGPNPQATRNYLLTAVERRGADISATELRNGAKANPAVNRAKDAVRPGSPFNAAFDIVTGLNSASRESAVALGVAGTKNLMISSMLGSTALIAVPSDIMTGFVASKFYGMPMTATIKRYIGLAFSRTDRVAARRSGAVAESLIGRGAAAERFTGEVLAPGWTRAVADTVLRASALSGHTALHQGAFRLEMMGFWADLASTRFDALPRMLVEAFDRQGIDAAAWDRFRAVGLHDPNGMRLLRPQDILGAAPTPDDLDLFYKFSGVLEEAGFKATPQATLRGRVALGLNSNPNTFAGAVLRTVGFLKNFPVTILLSHIAPFMRQASQGRPQYLAGFTAAMVLSGAMATQMGAIASGKDPFSMDPSTKEGRAFWGAAALKGGGLGILGDFLFSDLNRFGGGMADVLAGPMWQMMTDLSNLTFGNLSQAVQGEDTHAAAEALRFFNNYTPGSRLWYMRLAKDRLLVDQIEKAVDPRFPARRRRMERKLRRETGQRFWWRKGETSPERAPSVAN